MDLPDKAERPSRQRKRRAEFAEAVGIVGSKFRKTSGELTRKERRKIARAALKAIRPR